MILIITFFWLLWVQHLFCHAKESGATNTPLTLAEEVWSDQPDEHKKKQYIFYETLHI